MFEFLDSVDNELGFVRGEIQPCVLRLRQDRGPAGEFGNDRARRVPDGSRGEMFVRVRPACQSRRVETGLVRERRGPHVREVGVEREVDHVRDVV